jgi:hypothetical protein
MLRQLFSGLVVLVALVPLAEAQQAPPCEAYEADYSLSANLELSDTPKGQGNGVYPIGPGSTKLRIEGNQVRMVAYSMTERLKIDSTTLFWKTHVSSDSKTTVGKDACGIVSTGVLDGRSIHWTSETNARTDGTISCDGSLCGSFGAPPSGTSPLHVPPHAVRFSPWTFSADMKTFTMPKTWMSQSDMPQQTAHVALSGRETKRTCVEANPCPGQSR